MANRESAIDCAHTDLVDDAAVLHDPLGADQAEVRALHAGSHRAVRYHCAGDAATRERRRRLLATGIIVVMRREEGGGVGVGEKKDDDDDDDHDDAEEEKGRGTRNRRRKRVDREIGRTHPSGKGWPSGMMSRKDLPASSALNSRLATTRELPSTTTVLPSCTKLWPSAAMLLRELREAVANRSPRRKISCLHAAKSCDIEPPQILIARL